MTTGRRVSRANQQGDRSSRVPQNVGQSQGGKRTDEWVCRAYAQADAKNHE